MTKTLFLQRFLAGMKRSGCCLGLVPRESACLVPFACEGLNETLKLGPGSTLTGVTVYLVPDLGLAVSIITLSLLDSLWPSMCLEEALELGHKRNC